MENAGRYVILAGVILIVIGAVLYGAAKLGLPLGRLPGDIRIEGDGYGFYFPLATSIIVSVVLTVLLNIIARFWKK